MPGNVSSTRTFGLVAHAVPRRLPASLARITHSRSRGLFTLQHVEIRHRRPHVSVAEQFLHRTNVIPSFEHVHRETVAQGTSQPARRTKAVEQLRRAGMG